MEGHPRDFMIDVNEDSKFGYNEQGLFNTEKPEDILVPSDKFTEKGFTFKDDKIFTKDDQAVEVNSDWFNQFKDTDPPVESNITIDDVEYKLDDKGNAIDAQGQVVKTAEEIHVLETTVTIDEKQYRLDNDGNVLNEDKSIFMTAQALADLVESQNQLFDLAEIQKSTNIVITDDQGQPVVYKNDTDGLTQHISDVYMAGGAREAEKQFNNILARYPQAPAVLDYLAKNNGNIDGFNSRVDYDGIEIKADDKEQLKSIIIQGKVAKGDTPEEAARLAGYIINDGRGKEAAQTELDYLKATQASRDKTAADTLEQDRLNQLEQEKDIWGVYVNDKGQVVKTNKEGSVYDTIVNKGIIKLEDSEIKVPDIIQREVDGKIVTATKEEWFDYNYKVKQFNINNQIVEMSQFDYDSYMEESTLGPAKALAESLRLFTGKKFNSVIQTQVKAEKLKSTRSLYTDMGKRKASSKQDNNKPQIILPSRIAKLG